MQLRYFWRGIKNIIFSFKERNFQLAPRLANNYLWAFLKIPFRVPNPLEIQLEPSCRCNLSCKMCSLRQIKTKENFLTQNNFEKLLGEIVLLRTINFTGLGESLLNQQFEAFISKAHEAKVRTFFITNGQLLNLNRIKKLINSGIDRISISMESGDLSTYELIRRGAKFSKLKRNIEKLNQIKKEFNSSLKVSINVVLLKQNLEDVSQIYKIIDFASQYGIGEITFQNPHNIYTCQTAVYFFEKKAYLKKTLQLIKNYADKCNIKVSLPSIDIKEGSCYYPWVYPQITAGGELMPCCVIFQFGPYDDIINKFSFGNVFDNKFKEVWNSRRAVSFRTNLLRKNPNEYCRKCSKYLGIL